MEEGPLFRRRFHDELDALDRFFAEGVRRGELSAGTEDPDVRRIVEAMAFFAARTRAAASASMRSAIVRMAGGLLDDLFAPMPAVAMIQADAEKLPAGPADLPEGTRLRITTNDGRASLFVTRRAMTLWPIRLEKAELGRRGRVAELRLRFVSRVPQKGAVALPLFVRRHGDVFAAAELYEALARSFSRATARKDDGIDHPCSVVFGAPAPDKPWDRGEDGAPLRRIRSFLHAPEQEHFLHVEIPAEGGAWRQVDVTLAMDMDLPEDLAVSRETFTLYVVPAENAWSDLAEPIEVDGTAEAASIRPAQSALAALEPTVVRGVYRAGKDMMLPLPPRSLAGDEACYEVLFPEEGPPLVRINDPGAVAAPWKAQVDVVWSQPSLWQNARGPLSVKPQRRKLEGIDLRGTGNVRPPAPSALSLSPQKGLDVLALRQKPSLDARDVRGLMELLGASEASPFARFPSRISQVTSRYAPDPLGGRGPRKRLYRIAMEAVPIDERPLLPAFHRQMAALLDAWSQEPAELETSAPPARSPELSR